MPDIPQQSTEWMEPLATGKATDDLLGEDGRIKSSPANDEGQDVNE